MATFTKIFLSAATNGRPILVAQTATPGTTIHTATSTVGADGADEVWLEAGNITTAAVNLGLNIGTVTEPGQTILVRVPVGFSGPIRILDGHPLQNGLVLHATASTANAVNIWGYVNRITGQSS